MGAFNNCLRSLRVPKHVDARRTPRVLPRSTLLAYYSGRTPGVLPRSALLAHYSGRNPQARLVALSRIAPRRKCPRVKHGAGSWGATRQMHAWGHALRGLQTSSGSALSLLDRQPACLRNDALILSSSVSQRPQAIIRGAL